MPTRPIAGFLKAVVDTAAAWFKALIDAKVKFQQGRNPFDVNRKE